MVKRTWLLEGKQGIKAEQWNKSQSSGRDLKKTQKAFSRTTYISTVSIHQTFPILEFLGVQGISGILSDTIEQCSNVILKLEGKKKKRLPERWDTL